MHKPCLRKMQNDVVKSL